MSPNRSGAASGSVGSVAFTGLFMAGIVVVLVFDFLPSIDRAELGRKDAAKIDHELVFQKEKMKVDKDAAKRQETWEEDDKKFKEEQDAINERRRNSVDQARLKQDETSLLDRMTKAREERAKTLREEEKDLNKKRKLMQENVDLVVQIERPAIESRILKAAYWYRWGMMAGLMMVSIASLGYLSPRQTLVRRIVGAVVIVAVVSVVIRHMFGI